MEIISNTTDFYLNKETAVAMGKFDGIHIGHRRLLEEILKQKRKGLSSCVFTFDPPPSVLFGQSDGRELTTRREKRILFERMGVDILIEFPLNKSTAAMEPAEFARRVLAGRMNARFIAAGTDLSFGAKGLGNAELLMRMGPACGFRVRTIEKVCFGEDEVSSTYVRTQVEAGNMLLAKQLLGMPYTIMGAVRHGNRIGRTLGMPTVNLIPEETKLMPPCGVYFSSVQYGSRVYRSISNVGYKPTVAEKTKVMGVESYLYDFEEEIYGEEIEVSLYEFKRPERKFDGLEMLKAQLEEDIRAGAGWNR